MKARCDGLSRYVWEMSAHSNSFLLAFSALGPFVGVGIESWCLYARCMRREVITRLRLSHYTSVHMKSFETEMHSQKIYLISLPDLELSKPPAIRPSLTPPL